MNVPLAHTASKPMINTLEQWVRLEESAVINPVGNNTVLIGNKKGRNICCICLKLTPEQLFLNFDYIKHNNLVLHH